MSPGIRKTRVALASEIEPLCVGLSEAQTMTGISKWTWREWVYQRRIDFIKVAGPRGRVLIPISEIRRILAENFRPRLRAVDAGKESA